MAAIVLISSELTNQFQYGHSSTSVSYCLVVMVSGISVCPPSVPLSENAPMTTIHTGNSANSSASDGDHVAPSGGGEPTASASGDLGLLLLGRSSRISRAMPDFADTHQRTSSNVLVALNPAAASTATMMKISTDSAAARPWRFGSLSRAMR